MKKLECIVIELRAQGHLGIDKLWPSLAKSDASLILAHDLMLVLPSPITEPVSRDT